MVGSVHEHGDEQSLDNIEDQVMLNEENGHDEAKATTVDKKTASQVPVVAVENGAASSTENKAAENKDSTKIHWEKASETIDSWH